MTSTRKLGPFEVTAVGLGCMPLSMATERNKWILDDPDYAIGVIHAALDAGVQLLDTADIYAPAWNAMGHNERITAIARTSHHFTDGYAIARNNLGADVRKM